MTYQSIEELPLHCKMNLPEAALLVYRDAWNAAWHEAGDLSLARSQAWAAVRERFEKDGPTGRWVPKPQPLVAQQHAETPVHAVETLELASAM